MIRHADRLPTATAPVAIEPLPVAMIEPAFTTALMPRVGATALLETGFAAALLAAIAVSAIAVRADVEDGLALLSAAGSLQQDCFAVNRHALSQAVHPLDNGSPFMSG